MKSIISEVAICLSLTHSSVAFVPASPHIVTPSRTTSLSMAKLDMTPELEAAIAEVRECAAAFSDETAHFANGRSVCTIANARLLESRQALHRIV